MQNLIQKFRQSSIVFDKPGILPENLKTLTSSNYHKQFKSFCWNFAQVSNLPMSTKGCSGFFLFCLDLELIVKIKKDLVSTLSFFILSLIAQDLNKIKKNPAHPFVDITK